MKTKAYILITVSCLLFSSMSSASKIQKGDTTPVSVLLEQGIYTEETVGNIDRAIQIYRQIIKSDQENRKYAAEALYRLGRCLVEQGNKAKALRELKKLTVQYAEHKGLVDKANDLMNELKPAPIFPELDGCRLRYPINVVLNKTIDAESDEIGEYYQTDILDVSLELVLGLKDQMDRIEFSMAPADGNRTSSSDSSRSLSLSDQSFFIPLEDYAPDIYKAVWTAYKESTVVARCSKLIKINSALYSQLHVNDIQPDGTIQFVSAQQVPNMSQEIKTQRFRNSDFVHIEEMFDKDGKQLEFTSTHSGRHYRYFVTLTKPVKQGQTHYLGTKGIMNELVKPSPDNAQEFVYSFKHWPSSGQSTRRVDLYRLPKGAQLISTTLPGLQHRMNRDGRIEICVDTIIPVNGSLLTEFSYQLP